ncbi:hypothetical protein PFICI_12809 [Pestalotiopsis fici W106-1]|uniref:Uncharacterized protein n=1 Tax=Pestalotiopsis fici (strain W106-1 / CGMCC3.15140) TaxID=1229662 RepID=W3WPN8_PESFW|nr:uncharacterized protein PFICI_12809 [Pestalotiopsis fici W106-1]ETS75865.1 hypothetical protein PFICI_12809 [Pestalotiopsis fici W106-1]
MRSAYVISIIVAALPLFGAAVPAGTSSKSQSKAVSKTSSSAVASAAASSSATAGGAAGGDASTAKNSTASATASAVPAEDSNGVTMGMKMVSDTQIANAVISWMNDTGKVTNFLDTATSLTGDDFTRQATIALNAEKDELNHKTILDAAMGQQPDVQDANNVLAMQGTFQMVVDTLQKMVDGGPDTAQADVDAINQNRCVNVLPNIDKYFAAAGSSTITASRPTGCLEITGAPTSTAAAPADAGDAAAGDAASASTTSASSDSATSASSAKATASSGAKAGGAAATGNDASATSSNTKTSATRAAASAAAKTTKATNNN